MNVHHNVIRFALKNGAGSYVKSASFKPGPGYKVTRVVFGRNLSDAAPFSRVAAEAIASQYYRHVVTVHRSDTGELNLEATLEVQRRAASYRRAQAAVVREFNQTLREWCDAVPSLRKVLESL